MMITTTQATFAIEVSLLRVFSLVFRKALSRKDVSFRKMARAFRGHALGTHLQSPVGSATGWAPTAATCSRHRVARGRLPRRWRFWAAWKADSWTETHQDKRQLSQHLTASTRFLKVGRKSATLPIDRLSSHRH